jgi:DNA-binding transcriptional ArsR family regulator
MAAVNPVGQEEDSVSAKPLQPASRPARLESSAKVETTSSLLVGPESRHWRRQLGALAWVALEELALAAHIDHQGWAAALGVRDIASAIGTTKDTAARAVAALGAAGLVTLDRVTDIDGRSRSGYRLRLPDGIARHTCPSIPDDVHPPKDRDGCAPEVTTDPCPRIQDSQACPAYKDAADPQQREERPTDSPRSVTRREADSQPRLFNPHSIASWEAAR